MARLNESTASAEPIEILKRRFVRQNREIARVNSIQSLRIRSLESEISQLLSENVSLREQVINLTQDLERFGAAKTLHDGIYDVKARLDSKLTEMSSLIAELGRLPRQYAKSSRQTNGNVSERSSKESASIKEINDPDFASYMTNEIDGKLPVILEDKCYPRRTLGLQETEERFPDDPYITSSPGLENSVQIPAPTGDSLISTSTDAVDMTELVDFAKDDYSSSSNLETRRKERTDPTLIIDDEQVVERSKSLLDAKLVRKCGTKRKFLAEDGDGPFESAPAGDDDFEFSRSAQSPTLMLQEHVQSPIKKTIQPKAGSLSHGLPKRKVLESKSTNTSMISLAKRSDSKSYDRHQNLTTQMNNENSLPRQGKDCLERSRRILPIAHTTFDSNDERGTTHDADEARDEIERAVSSPENYELPEAADMSSSRPSRRRGTVVSYAEPNLRDKMRRSTNELGPAVKRDKSRRSTSQTESNQDMCGESETSSNEPLESHSKGNMSTIFQSNRNISGRSIDNSGETKEFRSQGLETNHGRNDEEQRNRIVYDSSNQQDEARANTSLSSNSVLGDSAVVSRVAPDKNRKSRRHSSSTRAYKQSIAAGFSGALDLQVTSKNIATVLSENSPDDLSVQASKSDDFSVNPRGYCDTFLRGSREMARGQRIAARRRSMML
ncbi:hypothetical protein BJX70DRAFT_49538 [Aspergillus crustosus]